MSTVQSLASHAARQFEQALRACGAGYRLWFKCTPRRLLETVSVGILDHSNPEQKCCCGGLWCKRRAPAANCHQSVMAVTRSGMGFAAFRQSSVADPVVARSAPVSSALAQSKLAQLLDQGGPAQTEQGGQRGRRCHRKRSSACSMRRRSICVRCARRSMPSGGSVATSVFLRTHAGTRQRRVLARRLGDFEQRAGAEQFCRLFAELKFRRYRHMRVLFGRRNLCRLGDRGPIRRAVLGRQVTNVGDPSGHR